MRVSIFSFVLFLFIMNLSSTNPVYKEIEDTDLLTEVEPPYHLQVWNDHVNTFDWVIDTLVQICGHSKEQAEQCALLIHYKGKYTVKKGSFEDLKPQCEAINDRNIQATLEQLA
jgi:ATP-dependent Clp protease adaptor protein ClpS